MVTVTKTTINVNSFKTVYDLINGNKPTGWTVLSAYPEAKPVFPCIIVNPARVMVDAPYFRVEGRKYSVEIEVDFYALAGSRKEAIDSAMDSVRETILTGESTLNTAKLALSTDTPFDQTNVDSVYIGENKLNMASALIRLRVLL